MEIKHRPVDDLIPYARNAKKHDDAQVAQIAASIREFGFNNPVLIDQDNGIIAGHGRVLAARKLGLAEVPCIRLGHLTDTKRRAYIIADNRLTETGGGWDTELLALELEDLRLDDFDLDLTGFEAAALKEILGDGMGDDGSDLPEDTEPEIDRAEELRQKWGVETGQLWKLGEHRLLCGDSTRAEDVARVMEGEKADICFTSPPYGQQRDYRDGATEKVSDWDALMRGVFGNLPMAEAGQVLVNLGLIHRNGEWVPYWDGWIAWMMEQGWRRFGWYVWDQGFGLPGDWNGRLAPSHEFVFHFNRFSVQPKKWVDKRPENVKARTVGASTMRGADGVCRKFTSPEASAQPTKIADSVIRINRMAGGHDINHPAIFPVDLSEFALKAWPGVAYEPFLGSGTTLIACENLKRRCRAIEISPAYCAVAMERWHQHAGQTPVLMA